MACNIQYNVRVPLRYILVSLKEANPNITVDEFLNHPDVKRIKLSKADKMDLYAANQITNFADIWQARGFLGKAERAVSSSRVAVNNVAKAAWRAGLPTTDLINIRDKMSLESGEVAALEQALFDWFGIDPTKNEPKKGSWLYNLTKEIPYKDFKDFVIYKHIIELNARANEMIIDDFHEKRSYLLNKYENAAPNQRAKVLKQLEELGTEPKLIDQKGGVTTEEAQRILQEDRFKGKEQIIRKYYDQWNKEVNIGTRLERQRGQNLTEEQYNQLANGESGNYTKFDWYVPMEVSRDALIQAGIVENDSSKFDKSGRVREITLNEGFSVNDRYDPFAMSLYRASAAIDRSIHNNTIETLGNLFTELKDPNVKISKIPGKTIVDEFGNFKGFQDLRTQDAKNNSLYYYKDGDRYAITFKAPPDKTHPIVEVFNMNPTMKNELLPETLAKFNKDMQTYMRMMFTSANPLFGAANFARDFGDIMLNIESIKKKTGAKNIRRNFIKNMPIAFKIVTQGIFAPNRLSPTNRALWNKYIKSGARIAFRNIEGMDVQVKKNQEFLKNLDIDSNINNPSFKLPKNYLKNAINLLENYNEVFELTNRFSLYKTLLETDGITDLQAAAESRRTMDFNETGLRNDIFGTMWLFFNAGVRGVDRAFETLNASPTIRRVTIDGKRRTIINPGGLAGKMTATLMSMGAMIRLMSELSDKSDCPIAFDEFKKENYIILPDPTSGDKCNFITIPKPYSFFRVPFAMGEIMADVFTGVQEPSLTIAFGEVSKQILKTIDPVGGSDNFTNVIPTTIRPLGQTIFNVAWHGSEIVPGYWTGRKTQPFYEKSYDYDSKAAKQMSKFFYDNVDLLQKANPNYLSPPALDYLFNSYLNIGLIKAANDIIVGDFIDPKVKRTVQKRGKKVTVTKDVENILEWGIEQFSQDKDSRVINKEFGELIGEPEDMFKILAEFGAAKRFYSRAETQEKSLFYILERLINVPTNELTLKQYQFFKDNIGKIPKSRRGADIKKDFNKKFNTRIRELRKEAREANRRR